MKTSVTSPISETANACVECGRDAPVLEALGARIPLRYCPECGPAVAAREAVADRERRLDQALERAGATPRLRAQSLSSYPSDGADAAAAASGWIAAYLDGERRNLWLTGSVGAGKTGLAWGIVRELAESAVIDHFAAELDDRGDEPRAPALFLIWRDLLADLREAISTGDDVAASLFDRAQRVPVLALDDLGAERPTPYALEALSSLVEARYQATRPTIVTSNYSSRELAARLGHEDATVGRRIVDRLLEGAVGFQFPGPSRRQAGAP